MDKKRGDSAISIGLIPPGAHFIQCPPHPAIPRRVAPQHCSTPLHRTPQLQVVDFIAFAGLFDRLFSN
jgi:hypothetical protein